MMTGDFDVFNVKYRVIKYRIKYGVRYRQNCLI